MLKTFLTIGAALLALSTVPAEARHRHRSHHTQRISYQPQVHGLGCLRPATRAMIGEITRRVGAIQITSTCGGRHAHNSQHYRGNAVDFRPLVASPRLVVAALHGMPSVGGIGAYSNGLIHADVGARKLAWFGHKRRFARHHHHSRYTRYSRR